MAELFLTLTVAQILASLSCPVDSSQSKSLRFIHPKGTHNPSKGTLTPCKGALGSLSRFQAGRAICACQQLKQYQSPVSLSQPGEQKACTPRFMRPGGDVCPSDFLLASSRGPHFLPRHLKYALLFLRCFIRVLQWDLIKDF